MSGTVLAGLMFGLMLALMAVRIPVALSMFLVGSAGYLTLVGLTPYLNYLKATGLRVGVLINFGAARRLEWKRLVR